MKENLYGVIPPMITPFLESGEVDGKGLDTLVDFLASHVDGLFICGSYGSGPLLSVEERKQVAEQVLKRVGQRIPVVVHTGTANSRDAATLSAHAAKVGAVAVAAVAPYYYHHTSDGVIEFYRKIIASVPKGFPVYVYHNPRFSGYEIGMDALRILVEEGIRGIKDATFDIGKFSLYMRDLAPKGLDIVLGTESLWLPACSLGAQAYIPGLGNAFPELCVQLHRQGIEGKIQECRKTQFLVNQVREVMYLARSTQLAVYAMLEIRGILKAHPRSPFVGATEQEKKSLAEALHRLGVLS
ncbi:MAG: dihydrodipicolinate synthase family protein [Spirochaetales bacterium]